MIEENLVLPFTTRVVGVEVTVEGIKRFSSCDPAARCACPTPRWSRTVAYPPALRHPQVETVSLADLSRYAGQVLPPGLGRCGFGLSEPARVRLDHRPGRYPLAVVAALRPSAAAIRVIPLTYRNDRIPMSNAVLYMSMSLDGFIAGPNEGPGNGLGDRGHRLR